MAKRENQEENKCAFIAQSAMYPDPFKETIELRFAWAVPKEFGKRGKRYGLYDRGSKVAKEIGSKNPPKLIAELLDIPHVDLIHVVNKYSVLIKYNGAKKSVEELKPRILSVLKGVVSF